MKERNVKAGRSWREKRICVSSGRSLASISKEIMKHLNFEQKMETVRIMEADGRHVIYAKGCFSQMLRWIGLDRQIVAEIGMQDGTCRMTLEKPAWMNKLALTAFFLLVCRPLCLLPAAGLIRQALLCARLAGAFEKQQFTPDAGTCYNDEKR